ncbi:response regulator transcription factor [Streptomyces sp. NPDC050528]|uniref:response regulator transcription factor n=1 Tax=unclassified Streptomyces TaxID=2593676 RepID=UPI00378AF102
MVAPSTTQRLLDAHAHRLPHPDTGGRPTEPRLERLTGREHEILLHMAEGLTNAKLADRTVVVAEVAVKTHVARILAKFELRDRVQGVTYTYEIGLAEPTNRPPVAT